MARGRFVTSPDGPGERSDRQEGGEEMMEGRGKEEEDTRGAEGEGRRKSSLVAEEE